MNVLVSCFACGPNWGSEVGLGWNWVIKLAEHCQLYVITESGFQMDIEEKLPQLNLNYTPQFYYIDIGKKGRNLFWQQGNFFFYKYYRKWQKKAFITAKLIVEGKNIDLLHQLNMTGFREPGYLWKIKSKPFIWGPVAGFGQIPWSFILKMDWRNKFLWGGKHLFNSIQMNTILRVTKAIKKAEVIISANRESREYIKYIYNKNSVVINDTGTSLFNLNSRDKKIKQHSLQIIWVGVINARKSLDIALKALSLIKNDVVFELHIYGNGPNEKKCKNLAKKLGISKHIHWHGRVAHTVIFNSMIESDFLFFTSLMEGTPTVVNEALSVGLPVICHDACGHGECVNENSGCKIPIIKPSISINKFASIIKYLYNNPNEMKRLSVGAFERAKELTWEKKAVQMFNQYNLIYEKYNSKNS